MTATAPKKTSAFNKPVHVSNELAEVIGRGPMARTEATKKLWEYIKKNKLQSNENKRNIVPDQKLAKVLGTTQPIDMFKLTSKVSKHLSATETTTAVRR